MLRQSESERPRKDDGGKKLTGISIHRFAEDENEKICGNRMAFLYYRTSWLTDFIFFFFLYLSLTMRSISMLPPFAFDFNCISLGFSAESKSFKNFFRSRTHTVNRVHTPVDYRQCRPIFHFIFVLPSIFPREFFCTFASMLLNLIRSWMNVRE